MTTETLPLSWIRRDGGTQVRAMLDQSTVERYRDHYKSGVEMPPPTVWHDGQAYWLSDGFQRCEAAELAGLKELVCVIKIGTQRDARLESAGANEEHGLPRTDADRRRAIEMLLADSEWGSMSTNWIKEKAKVSWALADKVRKEWDIEHGPKEKRTASDGTERPSKQQTKAKDDSRARTEETPTLEMSPPIEMPTEPIFDVFGAPVPPELVPAYMTGKELKAAATRIAKEKTNIEQLAREDGGGCFHLGTVQSSLDRASETIRRGAFYVVCPECDGMGDDDCKVCKGQKFLSDTQYQSLSPSQKQKCERHKKRSA